MTTQHYRPHARYQHAVIAGPPLRVLERLFEKVQETPAHPHREPVSLGHTCVGGA
jgi:hypothetical protein